MMAALQRVERACFEYLGGLHSEERTSRDEFERAQQQTFAACCTAAKQAARRFNQDRAQINRLPVEILGTVLERLAVTDRWTAAAVCNHWRNTALAYLVLWTDIECVVNGGIVRPSLSAAVERARDLPVHLSVRFIENFSIDSLLWFRNTIDLWTPLVKSLLLHFEHQIQYAYDDSSSDEDESTDEQGEPSCYLAPLPDETLGQALSSASMPRLESLELANIPFQLHSKRVPSLRNLISSTAVVLDCGGGPVPLAILRASRLSVATPKIHISTLLGNSLALQQFDITPCASSFAAALRLEIDPQPFTNLRYLRWPNIHGINRDATVDLIQLSSSRCWTHCMFPSAGDDEKNRRQHPLFENERLSFVVGALPSKTVSELHFQSAPGSAGTFARVVTVYGAQWLFPNISLDSDEVQAVCKRVASSLTTVTIPSSKSALFSRDSYHFPRLTVLSIVIGGERLPALEKSGIPRSGVLPGLAPKHHTSGRPSNRISVVPNLHTLCLRVADHTGWIWARRCAGRLPLNGQVTYEATWEDQTTHVIALDVSQLLLACLTPELSLTLVLNGIEMLDEDITGFHCARIEKCMPARRCFYDVPAIFTHDSQAYGMYASLARPLEPCK